VNSQPEFPVREDLERRLDRRRFLCAAGGAAALALGGEWAARQLAARDEQPLDVALEAPPELAVGEAIAVAGEAGREALLVRLDQTTVVSFDRRCPHLGCPVLWSAERARFECPCHHAAFDARTGEVLFGPPRRALTPARVHVA
jgi:Rieske Fe-S protein